MKKFHHNCKKMKKDDIIYNFQDGDGYPELVGKWMLDTFGTKGERLLYEIEFCPHCGKKLTKT